MVSTGLGDGPRRVGTEMSPWAAHRFSTVNSDAPGSRLRGVDIEEAQLPALVAQVAAANPLNCALQEMLGLVKGGYRRALASNLLALAKTAEDVQGDLVGGVPLPTLSVRTLEVEVDRRSRNRLG